jgi:hypothetical protein
MKSRDGAARHLTGLGKRLYCDGWRRAGANVTPRAGRQQIVRQ